MRLVIKFVLFICSLTEVGLISLIELFGYFPFLFYLSIDLNFVLLTLEAVYCLILSCSEKVSDFRPSLTDDIELVLYRVRIHHISQDGQLLIRIQILQRIH